MVSHAYEEKKNYNDSFVIQSLFNLMILMNFFSSSLWLFFLFLL